MIPTTCIGLLSTNSSLAKDNGLKEAWSPPPSECAWIHDTSVTALQMLGSYLAQFETRNRLDTSRDILDFHIDPAALDHPFAYDPDESADLAPHN